MDWKFLSQGSHGSGFFQLNLVLFMSGCVPIFCRLVEMKN